VKASTLASKQERLKFNLKNKKEDLINELRSTSTQKSRSRLGDGRKKGKGFLYWFGCVCYLALASAFFSLASWNRFFTADILDF
jgi:hypothetical protein